MGRNRQKGAETDIDRKKGQKGTKTNGNKLKSVLYQKVTPRGKTTHFTHTRTL